MIDPMNKRAALAELVAAQAPGLDARDERDAAWVLGVQAIRTASTTSELARSWAMVEAMRTLFCADTQRVLADLAFDKLSALQVQKKPSKRK